jgi:hypothetical protein
MTEDKSPVLVTLLTHTSGEWIKSEFPIKAQPSGKTNEMQALGSGITYLRRYAICSMLGIAQEDDDGSSAGEKGNSNSQVNIAASRNTLTMKNNDKWSSTNHNWAKILQNLCKEYSIEVKDFAQYHKITSSDADSVQNAVENFDSLMDAFITRSS